MLIVSKNQIRKIVKRVIRESIGDDHAGTGPRFDAAIDEFEIQTGEKSQDFDFESERDWNVDTATYNRPIRYVYVDGSWQDEEDVVR